MSSSGKSSSSTGQSGGAAAPVAKNNGFSTGVVNPSNFALAGFVGVFAAFIPVTTYLAKTGGWLESTIGLSLRLVPGFSQSSVALTSNNRQIAALATLYVFFAIPATGAFSAAGQAAAQEEFDNNTPRAHTSALRGLPLRLYSAHYNIVENFPFWAFAAALTQILEPTNQTAINLLGLAALTKIFVYYPAYIFDLAPLRTLTHVIHTSAVVNVLWKLSSGF